jgi:receptor protein-tyrosine kinase
MSAVGLDEYAESIEVTEPERRSAAEDSVQWTPADEPAPAEVAAPADSPSANDVAPPGSSAATTGAEAASEPERTEAASPPSSVTGEVTTGEAAETSDEVKAGTAGNETAAVAAVDEAISTEGASKPESHASLPDAAAVARSEARAMIATDLMPEDMATGLTLRSAVALTQVGPEAGPATLVPQTGATAAFDLGFCRSPQLQAQFRALRRTMLDTVGRARAAGRAPLVAVSSSIPGDGKSFVTFHLANSMTSEPDVNPVLVDGDLNRQQISRLFATEDEKGLADGLRQREPVSRLMRRTNISNLKLIKAGHQSIEAIEYLGGPRWLDLVDSMRSAGPQWLFILDTPPILATAEAQYIARSADLVLFVVRSETTPQGAVVQAMSRLGTTLNLAFVFNGRVSTEAASYYGYSYYESTDVSPTKD